MFKKIIISSLLIFLLFVAVITPLAKAQEGGTWYNQSFEEWSAKVFDSGNPQEIFGERYTYAQVTWILHSLQAFALGDDLINCVNVSSGDLGKLKDCIEGLQQSSSSINSPVLAIGAVGDSVLSLHPASGIEYVADAASRLKIIPNAYAQGIGFKGLQPALKAWKATRNMTYALSILAVIIMSFMIMFRVKISPQVVITVQSALPKIVIALLLITFSYAIAGFVIDLSYLVLGTVAALVTTSGVDISSLGMMEFFSSLVMGSGLFWSLIFTQLVFLILFGLAGLLAGAGISVASGGFALGPTLIAGGLGAILFLLLIIMMVFASIKILWLLVKTMINILLLIIVAPLIILTGTFSSGIGFGSWLKQLVANVAVFPVVRLMLFLSHYFLWGMASTDTNILAETLTFNPLGIIPFGGESAVLPGYLPFNLSSGLMGWIISFGILFLTPKVGDIIKSMIEGKPFTYGTAIGEVTMPARYGAALGVGKGTELITRKVPAGAFRESIGTLSKTIQEKIAGR